MQSKGKMARLMRCICLPPVARGKKKNRSDRRLLARAWFLYRLLYYYPAVMLDFFPFSLLFQRSACSCSFQTIKKTFVRQTNCAVTPLYLSVLTILIPVIEHRGSLLQLSFYFFRYCCLPTAFETCTNVMTTIFTCVSYTQLLLYIFLDIRHKSLATKGDAVDGKRSNLPDKDFISFRLYRMQCGQIDSHIIFDNVCILTNKYIVVFVYYIFCGFYSWSFVLMATVYKSGHRKVGIYILLVSPYYIDFGLTLKIFGGIFDEYNNCEYVFLCLTNKTCVKQHIQYGMTK